MHDYNLKQSLFGGILVVIFLLVAGGSANAQTTSFAKNQIFLRTNSTQQSNAMKTVKPKGSGGGIGKIGPIASETRMLNGMRICRKANDHPQKSHKNSPGHIDAECCLDPDETPNALCYYPAAKYGNLLNRYLRHG